MVSAHVSTVRHGPCVCLCALISCSRHVCVGRAGPRAVAPEIRMVGKTCGERDPLTGLDIMMKKRSYVESSR